MVYQAEMYLSLLIIINPNIQHCSTYSICSRGPCSCNNVALPFFHPKILWPTWICGLHDYNTNKILVLFPSKYDVDNTAAFIFIFSFSLIFLSCPLLFSPFPRMISEYLIFYTSLRYNRTCKLSIRNYLSNIWHSVVKCWPQHIAYTNEVRII